MNEVITKRLKIVPMSVKEMETLVEKYHKIAPELSIAYGEMIQSSKEHPEQSLWYLSWKLSLISDKTTIGYAGFKGIWEEKTTEIGYGLIDEFQGIGYASEAVEGLCKWAFATGLVQTIEAEADKNNQASIRVLQKNGFVATGIMGEEGPRFNLIKKQ